MGTTTRLSNAARLMRHPGLVGLLLAPTVGGGIAATSEPAPRVQPREASVPAAAWQVIAQTGGAASRPPAAPSALAATAPVPAAGPGMTGVGGASRAPRAVSVGCLIGPERTADIGAAVTGVIAAIRVDRGDTVRRGQPLVLLEQEIERANLQAATLRSALDAEVRGAEANLALARDRFERLNSLADSGAVAAVAIEQARAEREVAEQRVQQTQGQRKVYQQEVGVAQAQLAQRTLKAPFDGVVVERLAHEGERVEDKPLLRVAQLDPLRVELVMPASRWGSVAIGETMALLPDLPQAARVMAKVTQIDRTLDAASNTFRIRLSLPNPGHEIPAGARCKLDAVAEAPGTAAPPAPAGAAAPAATPAALAARAQPASFVAPVSMQRAPSASSRPRLRMSI